MCQVGECKTKFRKFSFTLSIWRDGFLAAVSISPTPDWQVENKCHGETGPLSAYKWFFQNTHQMSWRNALVQGKRVEPFSVLCWDQVSSIRCRCRGVWIQSEAAQMEQGITNHSCLYSAVYLLLMNGKFSDPLLFTLHFKEEPTYYSTYGKHMLTFCP